MGVLPRLRELEWKLAIEAINKNARQGVHGKFDVHIVWDMDTLMLFNTTVTKIWKGDKYRKELFEKLGYVVCLKREATLLVEIGEKTPEGCWIIGKHKNYWLKEVQPKTEDTAND
jgi:hypothetical protein